MKPLPISFVVSAQDTGFAAAGRGPSLASAIRELAELGYDGVELAVRRPDELNCQELSKLLSETGLSVPALGTGQAYGDDGLSLTDPDRGVRRRALERLRAHIGLAGEIKSPVVIIGLIRGRSSPEMDKARCLELIRDALMELLPEAASAGVVLALEPINRYETDLVPTLSEAAALLKPLGWQGVGLLPDMFHVNIEEADPVSALEQWGGRAVHVHIADSNRWAPGYGHLDLNAWLNALQRSGYQRFVSVECLPRPPATAKAAISTLRELGLGLINGSD